MRVVIQRVKKASVSIDGNNRGAIKRGFLVLLGIEGEDSREDADWLVNKIVNQRVFSDSEGKMNLSLKSIEGELLIVSQFTLFAMTKKGNRPSFIRAARPEQAIPLYESFVKACQWELGGSKIQTGVFGADMEVELINDGPVTITMDTKVKE
jgi:D-tyrosyl-tRNA(Tyr) deacylase